MQKLAECMGLGMIYREYKESYGEECIRESEKNVRSENRRR